MNTMQQEFDAVVTHLFKQGRPAKDTSKIDGPGCYYRTLGEKPLSCAVGCRIPDAVYDPMMDVPTASKGTGLTTLIDRFGSVLPEEITTYSSMFKALQSIHDGCAVHVDGTFRLESLGQQLERVAVQYGLTCTIPMPE